MLEITKENFDSEVKSSETPVIIDFFADWCNPCRMMAPIFEKLAPDYDGKLKFGKIDTEASKDLASQFNIMGIPCLIVFNKGEEVDRIVGFLPEAELKAKIDEVLGKV